LHPGAFVEPTLMVIGLNHRTPLATRERFWISENRRYDVLRRLKSAQGIEEIIILSTCCRTEFLVWASEPTLASNSIVQFLGSEHGLKLSEWQHFYRLLDDAALIHIFRVAAGLDSLVLGEPRIGVQIQGACQQARTVGAAGCFLNATVEEALNVAEQVLSAPALGKLSRSIPAAALGVAREIFGSLVGRRILLLGTAETLELSARHLVESGAGSLVVLDQSLPKARQMAGRLGGTAATLAERWNHMLRADIVISSTGCPHVVVTREEAERIAEERNRVALLIIDVSVPRDVDPQVRRVDGILLYDLEGLQRSQEKNGAEPIAGADEAEQTVNLKAQAFRSRLSEEKAVPTIVALRQRLEEICRQELESFAQERGPFTVEQDQSLHAITARVIQKIASSIARELKELPEREEQERMTAAVTRLFHLKSPNAALAGTRSGRENNERIEDHAVAI
jgi:glutamyl-tRNA reductase